MSERSPYRAVLIDLDGTLVDTLSEIASAANAMLFEAGREPVERDTLYRPVTRTENSFTVSV